MHNKFGAVAKRPKATDCKSVISPVRIRAAPLPLTVAAQVATVFSLVEPPIADPMIKTVSLNDIDLNVFDAGSGAPVLFVHGFPLDHTMWREQLGALSQTHRVIAPDLRGFGRSGVTPGKVTMKQYADDLVALLDHLQIRMPVTLCALSMGGYIAWQFFLNYHGRLERLILCDTKAAADSEAARENRLQMADLVLNEGTASLAENMPAKLFSSRTLETQPELVEEVRNVIRNTSPEGVSAALLGMAGRPDMSAWLGQIDVPTLLIVGRDDQISTTEKMRGMSQAIAESTLVVVDDAGHMAPLEAPEAVNAAIEHFLLSPRD